MVFLTAALTVEDQTLLSAFKSQFKQHTAAGKGRFVQVTKNKIQIQINLITKIVDLGGGAQ